MRKRKKQQQSNQNINQQPLENNSWNWKKIGGGIIAILLGIFLAQRLGRTNNNKNIQQNGNDINFDDDEHAIYTRDTELSISNSFDPELKKKIMDLAEKKYLDNPYIAKVARHCGNYTFEDILNDDIKQKNAAGLSPLGTTDATTKTIFLSKKYLTKNLFFHEIDHAAFDNFYQQKIGDKNAECTNPFRLYDIKKIRWDAIVDIKTRGSPLEQQMLQMLSKDAEIYFNNFQKGINRMYEYLRLLEQSSENALSEAETKKFNTYHQALNEVSDSIKNDSFDYSYTILQESKESRPNDYPITIAAADVLLNEIIRVKKDYGAQPPQSDPDLISHISVIGEEKTRSNYFLTASELHAHMRGIMPNSAFETFFPEIVNYEKPAMEKMWRKCLEQRKKEIKQIQKEIKKENRKKDKIYKLQSSDVLFKTKEKHERELHQHPPTKYNKLSHR